MLAELKLIFPQGVFDDHEWRDEDGSINFDSNNGYLAGGVLRVIVSEQNPSYLTYNFNTQFMLLEVFVQHYVALANVDENKSATSIELTGCPRAIFDIALGSR